MAREAAAAAEAGEEEYDDEGEYDDESDDYDDDDGPRSMQEAYPPRPAALSASRPRRPRHPRAHHRRHHHRSSPRLSRSGTPPVLASSYSLASRDVEKTTPPLDTHRAFRRAASVRGSAVLHLGRRRPRASFLERPRRTTSSARPPLRASLSRLSPPRKRPSDVLDVVVPRAPASLAGRRHLFTHVIHRAPPRRWRRNRSIGRSRLVDRGLGRDASMDRLHDDGARLVHFKKRRDDRDRSMTLDGSIDRSIDGREGFDRSIDRLESIDRSVDRSTRWMMRHASRARDAC